MYTAQNEENSRLDQQWDVLEAHYRQHKPVVARLLGRIDGEMRVDVNGIQGYVDHFVYGFTQGTPIKEGAKREEPSEEAIAVFEEAARQSLKDLTGKERLMRIVELDRKSSHLVLSQMLSTEAVRLDNFDIGRVYTGLVYTIDPVYIRLHLQGVTGWLPAKHHLPNQEAVLDLSTVLHLGQEVQVRVAKKQGRSLWLTFENFSLDN